MALSPVFLLSCAVSLVFILPGIFAQDPVEFLVRSDELEDCSSQNVPCRTLSEYASALDQFFVNNSTFTFMPGNHQLDMPLNLADLSNVALRAMDETGTTIQMKFNSSSQSTPNIMWSNCHNIRIEGLNFDIVGPPSISQDMGEVSSVLAFVNDPQTSESGIFLSDLTLRGSGWWRAIMLQNVDQVTISSLSVFGSMSDGGSAVQAFQSSVDFYGYNSFSDNVATGGGGAMALHSSSFNVFENISFFGNSADYGGAMFVVGGSLNMPGTLNLHNNTAHNGGAIIIVQSISVFNLSGTASFIENTADANGGALFFDASSRNQPIISGRVSFIRNVAGSGGAISLSRVDNLLISGDISFLGNTASETDSEYGFGGAVFVSTGSANFSGHIMFEDNTAYRGGALSLQHATCHLSGSIMFESNTATLEGGAVLVDNPPASLLMETQLNMTGNVTFCANSAELGGAIAFLENTRLKMNKPLHVDFFNNNATLYGGAIFVRRDATDNRMSCFAPPDTRDECFFELDSLFNINLNFSYNSAGEAGAALFGGNLEICEVIVQGRPWDQPLLLFERVATFNGDSITSVISSEPLRVYICDNASISNLMDSAELEIVRGTVANLSVVIVGQNNGAIPSSVRISLDNDVSIDAEKHIQDTGKTCTSISYRLKSKINTTRFTLFPDDGPCRGIGMSTASVNITFLPCPDGFQLAGSQCICEERLRIHPEYEVTCNVDDETIYRPSNTFWMGTVYDNDNGTDTYVGLILHLGCPIDYCTSSPINLTLNNLDAQCDHNHVGILCGSCCEKHSIAFGGLHCLKCSSGYVALILPFALAGIALVAATLLLKVSATANGTINGLIFYANVVQANRSVFIPLGDTNILTVFIAWLNLDLGIEACFYDGMTTYAFTWLQFLFPFYVWILIVTIIIVCHYSQGVSKIFGTNPVAALTTLLLLSYSKILRTVIFALSFTELEYPDGVRYVWRYDGSIPYFQRANHIALGIFAALVLLFLFVPYTLLLLCGNWLRMWSHWKPLSWINKIMPFLDAYYAP